MQFERDRMVYCICGLGVAPWIARELRITSSIQLHVLLPNLNFDDFFSAAVVADSHGFCWIAMSTGWKTGSKCTEVESVWPLMIYKITQCLLALLTQAVNSRNFFEIWIESPFLFIKCPSTRSKSNHSKFDLNILITSVSRLTTELKCIHEKNDCKQMMIVFFLFILSSLQLRVRLFADDLNVCGCFISLCLLFAVVAGVWQAEIYEPFCCCCAWCGCFVRTLCGQNTSNNSMCKKMH